MSPDMVLTWTDQNDLGLFAISAFPLEMRNQIDIPDIEEKETIPIMYFPNIESQHAGKPSEQGSYYVTLIKNYGELGIIDKCPVEIVNGKKTIKYNETPIDKMEIFTDKLLTSIESMGCSEDGFVVVVANNYFLDLKYINFKYMFQGPYYAGLKYTYQKIIIDFYEQKSIPIKVEGN